MSENRKDHIGQKFPKVKNPCLGDDTWNEDTSLRESETKESEVELPTTFSKKKKRLTKSRKKNKQSIESSSNSDYDEPSQKTSPNHRRNKKTSKSNDNFNNNAAIESTESDVESPCAIQDIRSSCSSKQEYIDNLLSYLKYNIKYVTNEDLKKELNDKMHSLEMEHKRKQTDEAMK